MATTDTAAATGSGDEPEIRTQIPARLDRLPWSRFHWLIVVALGVTWILDGLEVTLKGAVSGVLQDADTLGFTSSEIGLIASFYITGAVLGSLLFGYLTDRFGRKKLFFVTLVVYLAGALLTAFSWNLWSFIAFRFITGAGIGGEYAAINSTIDELIPARVRGQVDLYINGSYWVGAALGSGATLVLLDPAIFDPDLGWRIGFGVGAVLGLLILLVRRHVPESPRWLVTHGYCDQAEQAMEEIEGRVAADSGQELSDTSEADALVVHPHKRFGFGVIVSTMFGQYWRRSLLGLSLMVSQAFLYNAIFFTYAMVLTNFYDVPSSSTGLYLLPFAVGNFLGVARARPPLRHDRAPPDDHGDLHDLGADPRRHRLPVHAGRADGGDADGAVDRDLLHRLAGGELGLPDGERDLPARDAGAGDLVLLFARHRRRRHRRAVAVRHADRHGLGVERLLRLPRRRGAHAGRGRHGGLARRRRRGPEPRERRRAAVGHRAPLTRASRPGVAGSRPGQKAVRRAHLPYRRPVRRRKPA